MVRKNDKKTLINVENSIKKSNELSMAKLSHGLTLNQTQLLAFAIFSTQKNGVTSFQKADFEKKFEIASYNTKYAQRDAQTILGLKFTAVEDLEQNHFDYYNVFQRISYNKGTFNFKWSEDIIPHILNLKNKYVLTDLTITSQFKSSYSWILYDFLKAHYGYWHLPVSKEALLKLFGVENKKSYLMNTGMFKLKVLDVAISEINELTELKIMYKEEKQGKSIVGFDLHWSYGTIVPCATEKQMKHLEEIVLLIKEDMFIFINLQDKKNREEAIEMVKEIENMNAFLIRPAVITRDYANELIKKATNSLNRLNYFLKEDNQETIEVPLFNWLEGE